MTSRDSHQSDNAPAINGTGTSVPRRDHTSDDSNEPPIEEQPPLPFGQNLGEVDFNPDGVNTKVKVANDGRLDISIDQTSRQFSDLLAPALQSQLDSQHSEAPKTHLTGHIPPSLSGLPGQIPPPLNVVIHVVGSRGDVQPFVALGKVLKEAYGHRVRLATHGTFKNFVEKNGLEFFSIGGDPAELMAFMVKNPGLMPGMDSLKNGDVGKRRRGMDEIIQGCWRSCFEGGDGTTVRTNAHSKGGRAMLDNNIGIARPFIADAIIANPPSFAHIHCAEKLGVPLHLMFTMPWSPTQAFPHPLANVQSSNADSTTTNHMSYALVEMMTWQGLGDIINRFRKKSLGLEPVSLMWAPGMLTRLQIPYTYCWSPALIPKPNDWGAHIDISGFYFLSLATTFTPDSDLQAFLNAGPPPVYIGFGSIVLDDPDGMTELIFEAVKKSGQRALVSKGWGGFGADRTPDGVFMLGNVPHDWLFKHVSCVVHHGGAGMTAAGIALGKPTVVVPFFGDQPFWGAMVARAGAGPLPIPNKDLTADKLAAGILKCLDPNTLGRAQELGSKISSEQGTTAGAESFHSRLDVDSLRCAVAPEHAAVWRVKRTTIRLSAFAAATLSNEGLLDFNDLKLYRPREYDCDDGPWDPISGVLAELMGTTGSLMMGVKDVPVGMLRATRIKPSEHGNKTDQAGKPRPQPLISSLKPEEKDSLSQDHASSNTVCSEGQDDHRHTIIPNGKSTTPTASKEKSGQSSQRFIQSSNSSKSVSPHPSALGARAGRSSMDATLRTGKGIGKIMGVGLKSPMAFTHGLAKGFRNAPKLYGDDTVRPADKITGVQSGFKAVGKEFGLGLYDGITGLVTQPVRGAKKEGFTGAMKGVGKGIGGIILKPSAAACGVPGYAFKGIYKELRKNRGSNVQTYIIAARTAQGYEDWNNSSVEQRLDVVHRWQAIKVEIGRGNHDKRHGFSQHGDRESLQTRRSSFDKSMTLTEDERAGPEVVQGKGIPKPPENTQELPAPHLQPAGAANANDDHPDLGKIKRKPLPAASKGDSDEDQVMEKAIRALVVGLQSASNKNSDPEVLEKVIKASVAEAARARASGAPGQSTTTTTTAHTEGAGLVEDDTEHEQALRLHSTQDEQTGQTNRLTNIDPALRDGR